MCSMNFLKNPTNITIERNLGWNFTGNDKFIFNFTASYNEVYSNIYFNCLMSNDRYNPKINNTCLIETSDQLTIVVDNNAYPISNNFNRIKIIGTRIYIDNSSESVFFSGVNIFRSWLEWNNATIDNELKKMAEGGINFIRFPVQWPRFETSYNQFDEDYKKNLSYIIKKASEYDIFVELVLPDEIPGPTGTSWLLQYYNHYWWTNKTFRDLQYHFFYEFGRWMYENKFDNIVDVSIMPEASFGGDWYDPITYSQLSLFITPDSTARAEAEKDWENWLAYRGKPIRPINTIIITNNDKYEYALWVNTRLKSLIELRNDAFKNGSNYSYYTTAEAGQGGWQYDYDIFLPVSNYDLKPDFWMHAVDIPQVHNYVPYSIFYQISYTSGIPTYINVSNEFDKPLIIGETQWNYANVVNMLVPEAWSNLNNKLYFIKNNTTSSGFAIWSWNDYDTRAFGFEDINLNGRLILENFSDWNYKNLNESVILNLNKGLNFISLPFYVQKASKTFNNSNISTVYSYELGWKVFHYDKFIPSNLDKLPKNSGYFIRSNNYSNITIYGLKKYYKNSKNLTNLNLGWNLIGVLGNITLTLRAINNYNITELWTYNNGQYERLNINTMLIPKNAYWVYVSN